MFGMLLEGQVKTLIKYEMDQHDMVYAVNLSRLQLPLQRTRHI